VGGRPAKAPLRVVSGGNPDSPKTGTTIVAGSVVDMVISSLATAEVLDTPQGRIALVLARRLDGNAKDSGASVAALARQLDTLLEKTLPSAEAQDDPLDEVTRKREERQRNA